MIERPTGLSPFPVEEAIQDALNHAIAHGDDRTAFDLLTILRGMSRQRATRAASLPRLGLSLVN